MTDRVKQDAFYRNNPDDWYWKQMHGNEDDSHLSTGAWAHRHRNKRGQTLRFPCLTCNAKPRQQCRTYEGICGLSNRTAPHVYRWNQLRKEINERREQADKHLEVPEVQTNDRTLPGHERHPMRLWSLVQLVRSAIARRLAR